MADCKSLAHLFQIDGTTGVIFTFNDVINRTERLAAGLQELGVQKGDVICIVAPNHLEYSILFYATTLIAATLQTVNPLFTKGIHDSPTCFK